MSTTTWETAFRSQLERKVKEVVGMDGIRTLASPFSRLSTFKDLDTIDRFITQLDSAVESEDSTDTIDPEEINALLAKLNALLSVQNEDYVD